jgi:hypothetical protein
MLAIAGGSNYHCGEIEMGALLALAGGALSCESWLLGVSRRALRVQLLGDSLAAECQDQSASFLIHPTGD